MDSIQFDANGNAQCFSGAKAVEIYRIATLAAALRLYAKTKIKPSRHVTPVMMMSEARQLTGIRFKWRDYAGAADALSKLVTEKKQMVQHLGPEGEPLLT